jgi:hypothetical protein
MRKLIGIAVLLLGLIIAGCASNKELKALNGYNSKVSSKKVDGINIITKVNYWKGNPDISRYVTPVYVTIDNNSGKPLKISYEQFALLSPEGQRFSALPPFGIKGTVTKPVLIRNYNPIMEPAFTYHGFLIAPFYSSIYPGLPVFDGNFYYDPLYYDNYYSYWGQIQYDLPTPEMVGIALPEGVLKNGGEISGFLYFQKINRLKGNKVDFRADLVNSKTGDNYAVIRIPFEVVSE